MFEFGRDLRRLLGLAASDGGQDPALLELIGVDLLVEQARVSVREAGRSGDLSADWRAAGLLWREAARRTGEPDMLARARAAASQALAAAAGSRDRAAALLEQALNAIVEDDLSGRPGGLEQALEDLRLAAEEPASPATEERIAAAHARIRSRLARTSDEFRAAAALLDAGLHGLEREGRRGCGLCRLDAVETRLERAALGFTLGLDHAHAAMLDQAGRDLRALIEQCQPEYQPLTRARALAACGAGLSLLGEAAAQDESLDQGLGLIQAARDLFTPDHSPMDAAAVMAAEAMATLRCERSAGAANDEVAVGGSSLLRLAEAQRLIPTGGLKLAAEIAMIRNGLELRSAERAGDKAAMAMLADRLKARLAAHDARRAPVDWAVLQIALAGAYRAMDRLQHSAAHAAAAALAESEAEVTLAEWGVIAPVVRA